MLHELALVRPMPHSQWKQLLTVHSLCVSSTSVSVCLPMSCVSLSADLEGGVVPDVLA